MPENTSRASSRKRLFRSRTDRVLSGTAAGLAAYLDVDPVIVRVAFIVLCFATAGLAFVAYIALAVLTPPESTAGGLESRSDGGSAEGSKPSPDLLTADDSRSNYLVGVGLLLVGALCLAWVFDVNRVAIWGVGLIALGALFVLRGALRQR